MEIRECVVCGELIENPKSTQKYCCKGCYNIAEGIRKRERYRLNKGRPKPVKKKRKEKSALSVMAAEATKQRMSYGLYVAMKEMPNLIVRASNG